MTKKTLPFASFIDNLDAQNAEKPAMRKLTGFIAKAPEKDKVRIYLDAELQRYIELSEQHIRHAQPVEGSDLGAAHVWIDATAEVTLSSAHSKITAGMIDRGHVMDPSPCLMTSYVADPFPCLKTGDVSDPSPCLKTTAVNDPSPCLMTSYAADPFPCLATGDVSDPSPCLKTTAVNDPSPCLMTSYSVDAVLPKLGLNEQQLRILEQHVRTQGRYKRF